MSKFEVKLTKAQNNQAIFFDSKKIIITFKELSDFQACYAFMIGSYSEEEKSMLKDWITIKDFNCDQYAEVIYRAKILGSIQ